MAMAQEAQQRLSNDTCGNDDDAHLSGREASSAEDEAGDRQGDAGHMWRPLGTNDGLPPLLPSARTPVRSPQGAITTAALAANDVGQPVNMDGGGRVSHLSIRHAAATAAASVPVKDEVRTQDRATAAQGTLQVLMPLTSVCAACVKEDPAKHGSDSEDTSIVSASQRLRTVVAQETTGRASLTVDAMSSCID